MSEAKETRLYEIGFLLTPQFSEGEIDGQLESIKKVLTDAGATVTSTGKPEFIDLAYVMEKIIGSSRNKYRQAYFGWVKFEAKPEMLEALKTACDGFTAIIRYILLKTDAENSVVFKKPKDAPRREALDSVMLSDEELEMLEEEVEEHEKLPLLPLDSVVTEPVKEEEEQ